jgi:hypothetical protein
VHGDPADVEYVAV